LLFRAKDLFVAAMNGKRPRRFDLFKRASERLIGDGRVGAWNQPLLARAS
jgi:hypothetical protein